MGSLGVVDLKPSRRWVVVRSFSARIVYRPEVEVKLVVMPA